MQAALRPPAWTAAKHLPQPWTSSPIWHHQTRCKGSSAYSRLEQLAQKVSLKIEPQRQADIRRFWQEDRGLTDPALLTRAHRFSGVYPRYRDLKYLKSTLKVHA